MTTCKCGTALIPFEGYAAKTCSKCGAGRKDKLDAFGAVVEEVRKHADLPDKVIANHAQRSQHRVYVLRKRVHKTKYRREDESFVRAPRQMKAA